MIGRILGLAVALVALGGPAWAEQGQDQPMPVPAPAIVGDNARLAELFAEDQAARTGTVTSIDPTIVDQDAARRQAVRQMLDTGAIRSGTDYWHAAFIFQHGDRPDDYLLAHALSTTAIARGRDDATWIAAAALDRYLQSIGRAQIYGTQYQMPTDDGGPVTQGDYDRALIPDSVRAINRVPSIAAQQRQIEAFQSYLAQQ